MPGLLGILGTPCGMDTDSSGNLYIADGRAFKLWKVGTDGSVTAIAGNSEDGPNEENVLATETSVAPTGVAVDTHGNIYIAEHDRSRVRKIGPDGYIITVAGTGTGGRSRDGMPAIQADPNRPFSVCVDNSGNVCISEAGRVRKVDP